MKFVLLLSLCASVFANAGELTKEELLEIDSSTFYEITDTVSLSGHNVSILNACVGEDAIHSIDPISVCTKYVRGLNPTFGPYPGGELANRDQIRKYCVEYSLIDVSQPLEYESTYCRIYRRAGTNWDYEDRRQHLPESCRVWGTKIKKTQTKFFPNKTKKLGQERGEKVWLGKSFNLPNC